METNEPGRVMIVSYMPLLTGEPGRTISADDPELSEMLRQADECPGGHIEACLWAADGEHVTPVFIMDKAHAIADHLSEWSEERPGEWFALCFAEREGRYAAILFPNINQSVARFRVARLHCYEEIVTAKDYQVLFRPLCLVSSLQHIFSQVRCRIPEQSSVGFLDAGDVDRGNPLDVDAERIKMVGPFGVCWDCKPFGFDISGLVDEQIASAVEADDS